MKEAEFDTAVRWLGKKLAEMRHACPHLGQSILVAYLRKSPLLAIPRRFSFLGRTWRIGSDRRQNVASERHAVAAYNSST